MRRIGSGLIVLALVAAACGETTVFGPGTTATTAPAATTTGATATTPPTTIEPTTTADPLPAPGATPVTDVAYCVRGVAPGESLAVRSAPTTDSGVVTELDWDAADVGAGGWAAPDRDGRAWLLLAAEGAAGWAPAWHLIPAPCGGANADPAPLAGPDYPTALSGGLVPWERVDAFWLLAHYQIDRDTGPSVLYLLSPYGQTFEVFAWTGEDQPWRVYDWADEGRTALWSKSNADPDELSLLDLPARTSLPIRTFPDSTWAYQAGFLPPDDQEVWVVWADLSSSRVEHYRRDGTLLATLGGGSSPEIILLLPSPDGTAAVSESLVGLHLLDAAGMPRHDLDTPGEGCQAVRWWDEATILVRCTPREVLAVLPDARYYQLWLIPTDGSPGRALAALPLGPMTAEEAGFVDARRVDGEVFASRHSPPDLGCAGWTVERVAADGSTVTITTGRLRAVLGSRLVVARSVNCGESGEGLHLVSTDGTDLADLLIPPANVAGVIGVRTLPPPG